MLEAYKADGTLTQRLERARQLGNYRVRPDVARRAAWKMKKLSGVKGPGVAEVPPAWEGMPTTGTNKMLVFMIDFPDYPHVNRYELVTNKLFGAGLPADFPLESLTKYYERSSYGLLQIQGMALGWYQMLHNRDWYTATYGEGNAANYAIIKEVAEYFDGTVNYQEFDNNRDGKIDYLAVLWSGPDTGWSGFWWGYQWALESDLRLDDVQFSSFSWQWESNPEYTGSSEYDPGVIIHETGHALGLPDYYDYKESVGPAGGVGTLDMMDGNYGDHNAFSKFMMEWLSPIVVTNAVAGQILRATGQYPDAALVMNLYTNGTPFAEYFMVQNRYRVNNDDYYMPSDGMLVWHVDARLDNSGWDFLYDNSTTDHKLLRLMEADGAEHIEAGYRAEAADYYRAGASFTPVSTPNSARYDGSASDVSLDTISADGLSMTCNLSGILGSMFSMAQLAAVVSETSGVVRLTVLRSQLTNSATSVSFYTRTDTAAAGTDYVTTNGVLSFSAGQTTGTVQVTILNDSMDQPDQYFSVCLSNSIAGTTIGTPASATVMILYDPSDDHTPPCVVQALALDSNTVQIIFNEPLDVISAEERTNYTLSASVPTYAALASGMKVLLGVGNLTNGSYSVTVQNVKDDAGNKMGSPVSSNFTWQSAVALWLKLDEGAGVSAADSSGMGHPGVLENGAAWTTGRFTGGVSFDGINDQVRVPDFSYGPELTVSFWFRCSDNSGDGFQYLLCHGDPQTVNNVTVYVSETGHATPNLLRTSVLDADDPADIDTLFSMDVPLTGFPDDLWHLYTLTVKGGVGAKVYLDGQLKTNNVFLGGSSINPGKDVYLGAKWDPAATSRLFKGKLDDVRIYSRALSSNEVVALTNERPVAVAVEPRSITPYLQWESIPFSGVGMDPEGSDCKLVWWSDLVGYLGTGSSISNSTLPAGTPAVRLMAFDPFATRGETSCVISVLADADTNGLADTWATTYWPTGNSGGGTNDYDHDGRSNFEEWLAGTNPTNDQSVFRIQGMGIDTARGLSFDWAGLAGRRYSVYTATNLMDGFSVWTTNLRPAVDGILSATNAIPPGDAQRYFRIQVGR